MSIEGFFDFMIFGYLNLKTAEFSMSGEILGFGFGTFSITMSGVVLPTAIIILLAITKNY